MKKKWFAAAGIIYVLMVSVIAGKLAWSYNKQTVLTENLQNSIDKDLLVSGDAEPTDKNTAVSGDAVCPQIAITFDDGPNDIFTPLLLDGLKERNVSAAFFLIGEKIDGNEELLLRMKEEGHTIGNHTYSHVRLTGMKEKEACDEITKTSEKIFTVTGEYPMFIRPPFGAWKDSLNCRVSMLPVKWTIDTLDWTTTDVELIIKRAVMNARDNGILLLHDNYDSSVKAALRIIDILKEKGYDFVSIEEIILE